MNEKQTPPNLNHIDIKSNFKAESKEEEAIALLQPETTLERKLLLFDEFLKGLNWGIPRYGHPEGRVLLHVKEIFDNIERMRLSDEVRTQLRLISLVHDTFKIFEHRGIPRDWSRHHGVLARKFFEKHHADEHVLRVIEWHDEAYYVWCEEFYFKRPHEAAARLDRLTSVMKDCLQLYYLFFKVDTRTGDKNQAPLHWFEHTFRDIDVLHF